MSKVGNITNSRWWHNFVRIQEWTGHAMQIIAKLGMMGWIPAIGFGLLVWVLSPLIATIMLWQGGSKAQ